MNAEQNTVASSPKTLVDAILYFSDPAVAFAYFRDMRWPSGAVCCPRCGSDRVLFLAKQRKWECKEKHPCRQFTLKTRTIMEDSPMGLDKWAVAIWLEINAKNSISSYELHRALGITQKSAWFMLHRIRFALHQKSFDKPMSGIVEADETFVGGLARNMHKARRAKTITASQEEAEVDMASRKKDFSQMKILPQLPDRFVSGRGDPVPVELRGATIVNIGGCADPTCAEGGGLVVDFRKRGGGHIERIVFAFTELGMWVTYRGNPSPLATSGAAQ